MTLELIVFITAILFGVLLYWRESNGNGLYRFFNKIVNSKALQMKPDDKTGFVYQQNFILRLVFITLFFLLVSVVLQFITPIKPFGSYDGISTFASVIVGTLVGTYVANFVLRSGKVLDEKGDVLSDMVKDTVEKGKDFIEDIREKADDKSASANEKPSEDTDHQATKTEETPEKSARERLKDKGLL